MCVTVSATVALALLFGPKMYLVLLHPEKCARNYPGNKKQTNKPVPIMMYNILTSHNLTNRVMRLVFLKCKIFMENILAVSRPAAGSK